MGDAIASISHVCERLILPLGVVLVGYQAVTVWESLHGALLHYTVHVSGVLALASFIAAARAVHRRHTWAQAAVLVAAAFGFGSAITTGTYFYGEADHLEIIQPFIGNIAMAMGILLVAGVLIVTWLIWGAGLASICAAAVVYFTYGHLLPEPLSISQQPSNVVVSFLAGIGGPRGVLTYAPLSADMIFLLLIYGGLMHGCKVIDMFAELGNGIGNLARGGVAYSAIVASTLIGMVTGQAVSNIALSGIMTIPTMERNGFSKEQAGAIEVLASLGSQLLPPIMGLGAFLMAVNLGVSYIEIVIAGLIPGILFMLAVVVGTFALIGGAKGVPYTKLQVDWAKIWTVAPSFLVSFTVLIVLLWMRYSPAMAGFWGITVLLVGALLRPAIYRPSINEFLHGLKQGILTAVQLALILAAIGIVVQTLTTTGTGVALGRTVGDLSAGSLWIGLFIGMLVSLCIGMGLPTPAAYALIAIVVVPSLIDLGMTPLSANMFGFYFSIFSALTPPVFVGILTAVRISGGTLMGTTVECFKLGGVCFLVPYLFVIKPGFIDPDKFSLGSAVALIEFAAATALLAGALYGALGKPLTKRERWLFVACGPLSLAAFMITEWVVLGLVSPLTLAVWSGFAWRRRSGALRTIATEESGP